MKKFIQLSYRERENIYTGLCAKMGIREIAALIYRSASTISREIRRNSDKIGYLNPLDAQKASQKRRNKNGLKIEKNVVLKKYIKEHMIKKWSPETIAGRWNRVSGSGITISKEAIYQWLYRKELRNEHLRKFLVRLRKKRGFRAARKKTHIKNRTSIHDRPAAISQREEFGHFECDLFFNKGSQSKNVCVLLERVTRMAFCMRNENKRSTEVIGALREKIREVSIPIKSITFDNGSEFSDHEKLLQDGVLTYFCDPGMPWQKGSVEQYNGMARRALPFSKCAETIGIDDVLALEHALNSMPRKILNYQTPIEAMHSRFGDTLKKESRVNAAQPAVEAELFNQKESCVAFRY